MVIQQPKEIEDDSTVISKENVLKQRKERPNEQGEKKLSEKEMKIMNNKLHTKDDKEYRCVEIVLGLIMIIFAVAFGYLFWHSRKRQAEIDAGH